MAASARALVLSRIYDLSLRPTCCPQPPLAARHILLRPFIPISGKKPQLPGGLVTCLVSGVDGGGVSDDFVSTSRAGFEREFSVVANMLKRIKPLDTSVIAKGVSDSAKDSMKQTISTMLGLLPSDQFSVTVRVSKDPLRHLLVSSIFTGYALWNAEYRLSLMRNFELSDVTLEGYARTQRVGNSEAPSHKDKGTEVGAVHGCFEDSEKKNPQCLEGLPPGVLEYVKQLQFEVSSVKNELSSQEQQYRDMKNTRGSCNNLLKYLRSLDTDMVKELTGATSIEVDDIIHQLVKKIVCKFFKEEDPVNILGDSDCEGIVVEPNGYNDDGDTIGTSRDYLAKLLFWCMLMGHHLRGLENRLELSCSVGLL